MCSPPTSPIANTAKGKQVRLRTLFWLSWCLCWQSYQVHFGLLLGHISGRLAVSFSSDGPLLRCDPFCNKRLLLGGLSALLSCVLSAKLQSRSHHYAPL